ncbi:MAG: hypothetical protein RLZ92_1042 [Pseudomonadota bacterium]
MFSKDKGYLIMKKNKWLAIVVLNFILNNHVYSQQTFASDMAQNAEQLNYRNWVLEAELLRDQGDLLSAQKKLDFALEVVEKNHIPDLDYGAVELANGYNLFLLDKKELAEQKLKSAYQKVSADSYLHALADQYLANLYLSNGEIDQAIFHINSGLSMVQDDRFKDLNLSLQLLQVGLNNQSAQQQAESLLLLSKKINNLTPFNPTLALKLAQKSLDVGVNNVQALLASELIQSNYGTLNQLLTIDSNQISGRIKADAMGKLAQLLQSEQRHQEALSLIEQAIVLAYANNDRVLSAKLEAQLAEIFRLQGDSKRALDAYKQAVDDLHSVRTDIPISLPDGRSVLVAMIEPIYRNYVDLLLQTVSSADTTADQQLLMKAIDSMEAIKEADMQDFFLGRCSVSSEIHLDWKYQKFPGATIVYPILLNDRLEIIVKTDEKLIRHTVNVGADEVKSKAIELGEILHTGKDFRAHSKQLNEWLYLPLKQDLLESKTQVIIYVPDRSLRAIPLAAFSDGKNFVVEQYPVVTLPSLQLQNLVRNRQQKQSRALLVGLSKPDGSAIDSLPHTLIGKISGKKLQREALVEQLSLPSVEKEINTVSNNIENTKLLNNQFTASALKNDISTGEYGKVHIASHGYFGKNAKDSFIMAYDQNVNLIDFKNSLDADSLKREPIDLLTLSACKTAEGDDRMLLGFSGLAVKSNVLSAVGSLWSINDDATMEFMRLFYQGLDHSLNKAEAMRDAQVNMIKSKKFRHPFYWSPFILIGNWQ